MRITELVSKTLFVLFVYAFVIVSTPFAGPDFKSIDTAQLHSMVMDNAYGFCAPCGPCASLDKLIIKGGR